MNSKLAWGLAWAGLALVIAVPSLDFVTGKSTAQPAILTTDTAPVKVAATKPAAIPAPTPAKPGTVSINPDGTITKPVTVSAASGTTSITKVTATPPAPTTQVASLEETPAPKIAPIPAPLSERPHRAAAIPMPTTTAIITPAPVLQPAAEAPLVIDQTTTASIDNGPVPPAAIVPDPSWNAAQLRDYLDTHGMLTPYDPNSDQSDASVVNVSPPADSDYDPNGFYLSDGPNGTTTTTRRARSRWWTDGEEEQGFTLF